MNITEEIKYIKRQRMIDGEIFILELCEKLKTISNNCDIIFYVNKEKPCFRYYGLFKRLYIKTSIFEYLNVVSNISIDNFTKLIKKYIEIDDDIKIEFVATINTYEDDKNDNYLYDKVVKFDEYDDLFSDDLF